MKMVRSSGRFCLFSENKLQVHFLLIGVPFCPVGYFNTNFIRIYSQAVDFLPYEGEVQGSARNLVFFSTKLLMIEALRDPAIQRKYPNLAISKNCLVEK